MPPGEMTPWRHVSGDMIPTNCIAENFKTPQRFGVNRLTWRMPAGPHGPHWPGEAFVGTYQRNVLPLGDACAEWCSVAGLGLDQAAAFLTLGQDAMAQF